MNKRFNTETYPVLAGIIDNIVATLECPKFQEYKDIIEVDTWENIRVKMPHNSQFAESGFGFCTPDFYEYGDFIRIIVINLENCNRALFTEREIASIVFHELGHLLNEPELIQEPTFLFCFENGINYNKILHDEIVDLNTMNKEIYADSYANLHGYGDELISTFHKQNLFFEQKIGFFNERVQKIESKEFYKGKVMDNKGAL